MKQVDEPLRGQLATRVEDALERYRPRHYPITVNRQAILEDDGWYHVVVQTPDDVRDRDFYDAVANAEADLNEAETEHQFLLVPAIAD
jgi:hypothetical protein